MFSLNYIYLIRLFLVSLLLFFLSYEIVTFNEEFFIAISFFSFFFITLPVFGKFFNDFYNEDKNKFYGYLNEDFIQNSFFIHSLVENLSFYESTREFLYQNLNFTVYSVLFKFLNYFIEFKKSLNYEEVLPENLFLFYEKFLNFIVSRIQSKYLDYFLTKWDVNIYNETIKLLSSNNDTLNNLKNNKNGDLMDWIYG
jgi:hypothetical protein